LSHGTQSAADSPESHGRWWPGPQPPPARDLAAGAAELRLLAAALRFLEFGGGGGGGGRPPAAPALEAAAPVLHALAAAPAWRGDADVAVALCEARMPGLSVADSAPL
jgi:hypothetical protein